MGIAQLVHMWLIFISIDQVQSIGNIPTVLAKMNINNE